MLRSHWVRNANFHFPQHVSAKLSVWVLNHYNNNNSVRASDYFSFISSTNSCRADDSPSLGKRVRHGWLINWGSRNKCIKIFYLVMCRLAARRSLSDCGPHLFGHRDQGDFLRHAHRIVRTVGRKRWQLHAYAPETLGMLGATQML